MKKRRKVTTKARRRSAPKVARRRNASVVLGSNEQIALLKQKLNEALERQTATADILKVISRSHSNIQLVLDTIAEIAQRLCQSEQAYIMRLRGSHYHLASAKDAQAERIKYLREHPIARDRGSVTGRVAIERRTIHVTDALADPAYSLNMSGDRGYRTILGVPLLREGVAIGVIVLTRGVVKPFSDQQIELVSTFADQALTAIENARLFDESQVRTRELSEALEQQTATSEVLKVISSSPGELEPVFEAILKSATQICEAKFAILFRYDGETFYPAAGIGLPPALDEAHRLRGAFKAVPGTTLFNVWRTRTPVHTKDDTTAPEPGAHVKFGGARSTVGVPMVKEDALIGVIVVYRQEVRPFTDKQVELLTNFAAQAVIAIENARLLNELRKDLAPTADRHR